MKNKKKHLITLFLLFTFIFTYSGIFFHSVSFQTALDGISQGEDLLEGKSRIPKSSYLSDSYPTNETIALIINSTIWGNINAKNAINQYEKDLKAAGFNTIKYTMNVTNVKTLRDLLKGYYENNNTVGATLIGDFPYIWYSDPWPGCSEIFECDLYLMDLDGTWWDTDGDGIYEDHNATSGADTYPEIYVSRINAENRKIGTQSNAQDITNLITRFHNYRMGNLNRNHKALMYVDDDWQGEANGTYDNWPAWLDEAYPNHDDIHTPTSWTNKTDWLTKLNSSNYEFAHLAVHTASEPAGHRFGPDETGIEGNMSATDIDNNGPGFTFYNLFCCRGADYNTTNCMANTYLFSGSYAQSVLGTTKAGGMLNGGYFYDSLAENNTFGHALIDWFQSYPDLGDVYSQSWFYGLCILGDPFSTIHHDCSVPKPDITVAHPHYEDQWSNVNSLIRFNWTCNADMSGLDGYYYIYDQNPNTVPTKSTGTYVKANGTSFSNVADGVWYLHVVAKDKAGNVGEIGDHFKVKIDTTGPVINLLTPMNNYNSSSNSVFISYDAIDLYNAYVFSSIYDVTTGLWIDGGSPNKNATATSLIQGQHIINITCSDNLVNPSIFQFSIFVDLTDPFLNITNPLFNATVDNTFKLTWQALDGESGIRYTEIYSDGNLVKTVNGPLQNTTISGLSGGTHTINVTTYDWSGRSMSQTILLNVGAPPPSNNIPGFFIEVLLVNIALISLAYYGYCRRIRKS
ncbi:MAG: hypothetical protein GF317_21970 [Candidatus Lokiarchaeota archaeon]|nr:hypothetical protein [Candidatus Lokiarchaeota archaeon]MBD3202127.1 hypothetical protein [Candidatus Lokiarchaeota archaeon]